MRGFHIWARSALAVVLAISLAAAALGVSAKGGGHSGHSSSSHSSTTHSSSSHASAHPAPASHEHAPNSKTFTPKESAPSGKHGLAKAQGVQRDERAKISRSAKAKNEFRRTHPCPSTGHGYGACPGYVIDHVKALKRGGQDGPSNMQWQTVQAAKAKDRVE